MRNDTAAFRALLTSESKEYRFVVGIIYDVDSIYLTSHDDISGVPGTILQGVLQEPVIVSQRLQPDEARAEIGTASFAVVDIASQFTNEIRERFNDGTSLRGRECRFYFGFKGQSFADLMLIGTQKIDGASYHNGRYNVACADIQRSLKKEVFDAVATTVASTVTAGDTTINATDTTKFQMVFHGASYTDAPNSTVGYFKLKNTIYRYTGKTGSSFTGCAPVFGTVAETVTVDPAVAADRREKIVEYIYLELPAVKLALAILTGNLYNDGATLPAHWHLATPDQWVTEEDFTGIGTDLWNPATDASPNAGYIVRFEGLTKTDGKAFLEREIYLLLGLFSPVYADGSLGLKRMSRIGNDAAHVAVLDNSNSTQVGELRHDMKSVHNIFRVNWSWNGTRFNRANDYFDLDSRAVHKDADLYERSFKGLHGSIHADSAVFQQLDTIRDRYAGIPEELTATLLDSMNYLEVGDVVRGRWQHVRDFSGPEPGANDPGIDRAFEIQNISCDFRTGVTVELFGSTARASVQPSPTAPEFSLPNDFYDSEGTPLSSAPGITIISGIMTAASGTLTGNASLTNAASIYYHTGPLTIASGVTFNIGANVQLRIRGFLQVNGTINGVGRGRPGVADDGRALQYVFTESGIAAEAIPGNPGYVGSARGRDGVRTAAGIGSTFKLTTWPPELTASRHPVAPVLTLQYDEASGDLLGLPDDLRGTGGAPGGRVGNSSTVPYPSEARGGTGGAGGAGALIICRGMARGANGIIDLSGANSAPTTVVSSPFERYPGAGGAGGPGTLYVLLDGSALSVPDLAAGFFARTGDVPAQGNPLPTRRSSGLALSGVFNGADIAVPPVSGFADPAVIDEMNLSGAALRIQYIPGGVPQGDAETRPPPLTGMTATSVPGAISISVTAPPPEQWDVIGYYAAATNDRTGATLVNTSRNTTFDHAFATATTRYYWARTRLNGVWSDWYPTSATGGLAGTSLDAGSGSAGESIEVQFSVNGSSSWHSTFTTGDLYMRTRVGSGGAWQGPWRVVGEDGDPGSVGADGNVTSFIFRRSATQPATPTGNAPSGWSDSPPSANGNPLWVSRALKTPAGILVGSWSVPTILVVDGEDGEQGLPGIQGPGMFDWANPVNVTTTSTSITRNSGGGAWTAGAHSLQSYSAGCFFTVRAGQVNTRKAAGFNDDPATDSGFSGITRGWWLGEDGLAYIITNGVQSASHGSYLTTDDFQGVHDGEAIRLYKNGVAVGSEVAHVGRLFLDVSIWSANGSLADVHFGPSGLRGPQGAPPPTLRLTASSQTFTFPDAGGASTPASITFTATRQNIAQATTWTTTPSVTLTGSGDTRVLTGVNFAGNSSVRVRAEANGFFDEITVVRLTQGATGPGGQASIVGYLTNESHTVPADQDGVVTAGDLASANGLFRLYEGVVDRTALATFVLIGDTNCVVQLNTADNTPVAGQVRGFYRVQSIQADQAFADFRASYNGVDVVKRFSVTRARAGRAGDGQNLLPINDWVVGTTGSQGGKHWLMNGTAAENAIVLGGAGTAPLGPYGTSEILWECRPSGGPGNTPDGGWDTFDIPINHRSTYRSTVWFRVNQISGNFYHGCRIGSGTLTLAGGLDQNPYFVGATLGFMAATYGIQPNKWYLSVGIIHGSGYTGGDSGVAGIYDPESGRCLMRGTEFKNATTTLAQSHRCYHFYDPSAATRQWMPKPRLEEVNGSEPTINALLGFQRDTPWISRGFCYASARVFYKIGGANSWEDSDIYSSAGYSSCHLQFKAASTTGYFMVGISNAPGQSMSYTNMSHAWYGANGAAQIYEGPTSIMDTGPYTAATQFGIKRDTSGNVTYWRDGVQINRGATSTSAPLSYLDSSFYTPGTSATNVAFGPGTEFELINSNDMAPGSATKLYSTSAIGPIDTNSDIPGNASAMVVALSATCNDVNAYWLVTVTCEAQHIGGSGNLNFIGAGYRGINPDSGVIGETGTVGTYVHAGQPRSTKMVRALVPATKGDQVDLGLLRGRAFPNNVLRFWNIYVTVELIVR